MRGGWRRVDLESVEVGEEGDRRDAITVVEGEGGEVSEFLEEGGRGTSQVGEVGEAIVVGKLICWWTKSKDLNG
jgi:hypothetical protein